MAADHAPHTAAEAWDPIAPFLAAFQVSVETALRATGAAVPDGGIGGMIDAAGGPEGDFALPVHRFAGTLHRRPDELAAELAASIGPVDGLSPVTAKGAYVNAAVRPSVLIGAALGLALTRGPRYGHSDAPGPSTCIEHTSANPTGPFHIGRVRNAIIGDTLARIVRATGAPVTTQYYVDDMGRQAALITWIWTKARAQWPPEIRTSVEGHEIAGEKPDAARGRPYPPSSAYLKIHPEAQAEVQELVRRIEDGDAPPEHRALAQEILGGMLASLGRLGIAFDEFVWESDLNRDGSVEGVLERLRKAPHAVQEENGAWAIDAGSYGLPKESSKVVFQRGNGTSLYVTRDVAYHLTKFARFSIVLDVLGQDHQLHARTLDALLAEVGEPRRPAYLIYQDITVPGGGRMSTRSGSAVWLDALLEEAVERARKEVLARREDLTDADVGRIAEAVATGAIRFHILRVAAEKPVVFRWEDALSFEGRSGPFVQYSYARASSVLRKSGIENGPFPFDPAQLSDPEELALVRVLAHFPSVVDHAARTRHAHAVAGYVHELADQFNRFYHAVPVLKSGAERPSRIALVAAVRQTLGNGLDLLGVPRLETM
jgi:arginyl-tRNA synthetase